MHFKKCISKNVFSTAFLKCIFKHVFQKCMFKMQTLNPKPTPHNPKPQNALNPWQTEHTECSAVGAMDMLGFGVA